MMKNRNRVKKPHYVQRSYLERWCKGEDRIHAFDKVLYSQFQTPVRDACSETGSYDDAELDQLIGEPQFLEDFFTGFESRAGAILKQTVGAIRAGTFSLLDETARLDLAIFLGVQQLRTKRTRLAS